MRRHEQKLATVAGLLRRMALAGVAAVVVVTLGSSVALFYAQREMHEYTRFAEFANVSARIQTSMLAAQAAYRGYLIEGQRTELDRMQIAEQAVLADDERLAQLAPAFTRLEIVEQIRQTEQAWFEGAKRMILARDSGLAYSVLETGQIFDYAIAAHRHLVSSTEQESLDRRKDYQHLLVAFQIATGVLGALAVAGSLLYARRASRRIANPLRSVALMARSLREGDLAARVAPTNATEEVAQLEQTFNELAGSSAELEVERQRAIELHKTTARVIGLLAGASADPHRWSAAAEAIGRSYGVPRVSMLAFPTPSRIKLLGTWRSAGLKPLPMGDIERLRPLLIPERFAAALPPPKVARNREEIAAEYAPPVAEWATSVGLCGVVSHPLSLAGRLLGYLVITSHEPISWSAAHADSLARIASVAADAIAEGQLAETRQALDQQKSDFMATTSHELRTPLTSIAGYLEMLAEGDYGELTASQEKAIGVIERNVQRLRSLIEDQLILNRLDSGKVHMYRDRLSVAAKVRRVVENMTPQAREAQVELVNEGPVVDARIRGDRDQIERAISNVIGNAIKFSPIGRTVHVLTATDDQWATISVTDEGMGIPAAEQDRLFERFYRASNARKYEVPGTGLGLAIVKAIIEGHGGSVGVDSTEGVGTTVFVRLPIEQAPEGAYVDDEDDGEDILDDGGEDRP